MFSKDVSYCFQKLYHISTLLLFHHGVSAHKKIHTSRINCSVLSVTLALPKVTTATEITYQNVQVLSYNQRLRIILFFCFQKKEREHLQGENTGVFGKLVFH